MVSTQDGIHEVNKTLILVTFCDVQGDGRYYWMTFVCMEMGSEKQGSGFYWNSGIIRINMVHMTSGPSS